MASAFGVFANHGVRVEPTPVLRILDVKGETVEDNRKPNGTPGPQRSRWPTTSPPSSRASSRRAPARRAKIGRPAAGKTGTSENWENAWFVGYTPTLSTAVWMGHPDANITMANVHGVPHVVGGSLPAMIWHDFMVEAVKDVEPLPFTDAAPILPSRAEAEAKARVVAEMRLTEREGFDIPPLTHRRGPPLRRPAVGSRPEAQRQGSAGTGPRRTTSTTGPPSSNGSEPEEQEAQEGPSPPPESPTTTTQPPPSRRPPPPRDPLPLPFGGD